MPKVRLNYDGWLALPETVRRALGVGTGDQLDLEVVGRAAILRPTGRAGAAASATEETAQSPLPPAALQAEAATPEAEPGPAATPAVKRGPGRPRKNPAAAVPASKPKARGRRAAAPVAE